MMRLTMRGLAVGALCLATLAILGACDDGSDDGGDADGATIDAAPTADAPVFDAGPPSCEAYCATIQGNCTMAGGTQQYGTMGDCIATCSTFAPGAEGETTGNTLGCRQTHAAAAAGDPTTECVLAGPGGAGTCGSNCESFCNAALAICTGMQSPFTDLGDCMTQCASFPATEKYDTSDFAGDTFACRLYHLTAASTDMATHCQHIGTASDPCQ